MKVIANDDILLEFLRSSVLPCNFTNIKSKNRTESCLALVEDTEIVIMADKSSWAMEEFHVRTELETAVGISCPIIRLSFTVLQYF